MMEAVKISEHVYWVGAIDWNIRDFHGYSTKRGTTYNAYLVMGEKPTLVDTVKNYQMGNVVSVWAEPAVVQVLDQESRTYVDAVLEGFEDVYVTVESTCTDSGEALLLDGGYDFRVGQTTYVRGPGYMGSGPVTEIVREAEG